MTQKGRREKEEEAENKIGGRTMGEVERLLSNRRLYISNCYRYTSTNYDARLTVVVLSAEFVIP